MNLVNNGKFYAFEFKWSGKKPAKSFDYFGSHYPIAEAKMISKEDIEGFIG